MKTASTYFVTFALFLAFMQLSLVLPQGIDPVNSQISTTFITNSESSLQRETCRCDLISSVCDDKCCCDAACPASYIATWKAQNLCTNQEFIYSSSSIDLCSKKRPKTIDDLRSGLRIYYQILKILFCVAIDNSDITDRYKDYQSSENIAAAVANTQPSSVSSASSNKLQSQTTGTTHFSDHKIPRPGFGSSLCNSKSVTFNNNLQSKDCYQTDTTISTACTDGTLLDASAFNSLITPIIFRVSPTSSSIITLQVRNISLNDPTIIGYQPGDTNDLTPPIPDPILCTCSNFLSGINYQFVMNSNNQITEGFVDLVITSAQTFSCENPRIKQTTSLYFVNEQINVPRLKGPGYRFDDPILIGTAEQSTATGLSIITAFAEPLSLLYLNTDGECAMENDEIDPNGKKSLEFGSNHIFSCGKSMDFATFDTFCDNNNNGPQQIQMYQNILTHFKYLAKFPNANPSLINDWISTGSYNSLPMGEIATGSKTCSLSVPKISIFYSAIGTQMNPGYKINSVAITSTPEKLVFTQSSDTTAQTFNFPLYVNFIPLPQSTSYFVAPAPTVNVKLPDNVLTPFIRNRS